MTKLVLSLLLTTLSLHSYAQTSLQCKIVALRKEASGEGYRGQKAVLEVIERRMKALGKKSACSVVKAQGQFPWAARQKSWKFSQRELTDYFKVFSMLPVVPRSVYYFNNRKFKTFGRYCCRVGRHYFYYQT